MSARTSTVSVHRAPWVLPVAAPPIRDGAVRIADGRIEDVGPADDVLSRAAVPDTAVREWDGVLIPGLVNAH